jgi:hypothetical protein
MDDTNTKAEQENKDKEDKSGIDNIFTGDSGKKNSKKPNSAVGKKPAGQSAKVQADKPKGIQTADFSNMQAAVKSIIGGLGKGKTDQRTYDLQIQQDRLRDNYDYLKMVDPIISEAENLEELDEIFLTIAETAPRALQSKQLLAQKLRKAVEYGGLDAMDLKELVELETSQTKLDLEKNKLDRERYA